jgi:hypothetical protein
MLFSTPLAKDSARSVCKKKPHQNPVFFFFFFFWSQIDPPSKLSAKSSKVSLQNLMQV